MSSFVCFFLLADFFSLPTTASYFTKHIKCKVTSSFSILSLVSYRVSTVKVKFITQKQNGILIRATQSYRPRLKCIIKRVTFLSALPRSAPIFPDNILTTNEILLR